MGAKCEHHFCSEPKPKKFYPNWMSKLPDSVLLTSLTIPGTHNSCSFYGTIIAITQTWAIPLQLKAGLRYFDIRLRVLNDTLRLQHGIMDQKINFDVVLRDFKQFLTEHPKECIFMAVQKEYTTKNSTKSIEQLFEEYTKDYKDIIIEYKGNNFAMKEMRGKIVFINVFDSWAIRIPNSQVQNEWVVNFFPNITDKKRKIKRLFNQLMINKNDNRLYINYLSGVSDYAIVTPAKCADETNKVPFKYKGRLGVVLCDFPSEDLVEHLIMQNFNIEDEPMEHSMMETIQIESEMKVHIINCNTLKYLNRNGKGALFCSKTPYTFIIEKIKKEPAENIHKSSKDIVTGESIKLTDTNNEFEFELNIEKLYNTLISGKEGEVNTILEGDVVKLYRYEEEAQKKKKVFLCSDYSTKDLSTKVQNVLMNQIENDSKNRWLIKIVN